MPAVHLISKEVTRGLGKSNHRLNLSEPWESKDSQGFCLYKVQVGTSLQSTIKKEGADRIHERDGDNVPSKTPGQGIDPVIVGESRLFLECMLA